MAAFEAGVDEFGLPDIIYLLTYLLTYLLAPAQSQRDLVAECSSLVWASLALSCVRGFVHFQAAPAHPQMFSAAGLQVSPAYCNVPHY